MKISIITICTLVLYGSQLTVMTRILPGVMYIHVGKVTSSIASTFDTYKGISKARCLGKCTLDKCLMAGWGSSGKEEDCRILIRRSLPVASSLSYTNIPFPLHIYVRPENKLPMIDKSYALLLHSKDMTTWQNTRAFCKSYGLGLYTPVSQQNLADLFLDYEDWWAGINDIDVESSYKTDEGTTFSATDDKWCSGEPNDYGTEDCIEVHNKACFNDEDCPYLRQGFCKVGD